MEDTGVTKLLQCFFFGVGAITTSAIITYIANTYGERIVTEVGWLACSIDVKVRKLIKGVLPQYMYVFPQPEATDVHVYNLGKIIDELSYIEALEYEPKTTYELVSYTVCGDDETAYTALHSDIKMLTDKVKGSPKKFLTAMMKKGNVNTEVRPRDGVNPYVVGNILFNPSYIRWTGIDVANDDEYEVHLIDSDIVQKIISWNTIKREVVKMTADGYEIENVEIKEISKTDNSENERSGWFGFWTSNTKTNLSKLI